MDKTVTGGVDTAIPIQSIYQNSTITNLSGGLIKGDTESGIAVLGTTGGGFTVTINNNAGATIEGNNSGVSEDVALSSGPLSGGSLNQGVIELDDTSNTYVINESGTILQDATTTGTAIAMNGAVNTLNITGGAASIVGNIAGNTAANSTLNITPGAGNSFSYGYNISNFTVNINADGSNGTVILSGANTYSGPTTLSGGTLYVNNTSGSGTGTGAVSVHTGATLGGTGTIQPGAGNGITLGAHSTLVSGGVQSGTTAGPGLTLDNTVSGGTILDASVGSANLTFFLGAGTTPGAGAFTFGTPNQNSSYLTVLGDVANELKFAAGDTITVNDLTGGSLQLESDTPYLLIKAASNADYSGLVTTGDVNGMVNQNGYVTTSITIGGTAPGTVLYLNNGQLEAVVPEPGTWAMLLGGLGLVAFLRFRLRRQVA